MYKDREVTSEQHAKLKALVNATYSSLRAVGLRLFLMVSFFALATLLIGSVFVPGSGGFIVLGNAIGAIFALVDAIEGSEAVLPKLWKRIEEMSVITRLHSSGLIKPPPFVVGGTQYETIMGSQAYGVSSDNSDMDIYGFCIPPKDYAFPHLRGEIEGFGTPGPRFEQYQQHHVKELSTGKEYDLNIYNIVKYFDLCLSNNPNMIDSLFTPEMCVTKSTKIGQHVRDNRKLFLHKGAWHRFKGYAYSQMHKMRLKSPQAGSKRQALVAEHGYDIKFAYHIVRLLNEVEQILVEGDLDLQRNNDQLKAIRRGEWTMDQIEQYFVIKEKALETTYAESKLQHSPDEMLIKRILMECLEEHYGSLEGAVESSDRYKDILREIQKLTSQI